MKKLIDTHAHLEEIEDLSGAIERAGKTGVFSVIAVGMDYESCRHVLEISGKYDRTVVYPALGIHPWKLKASQMDLTLRFIEEHMDRAVAVGEIGLDYWLKEVRKDTSKKDLQKEVFKRLLDLGKLYKKPALVHGRGAWEDCFRLTVDVGIQKAVFHWFSGPLEILDRLLNQGYLISATPAVAYSDKHREAVSHTPLESLLLETDSPVEYQGKESQPGDVFKTLEAVAALKGVKKEEVADITTRNALKFFDLEMDKQ